MGFEMVLEELRSANICAAVYTELYTSNDSLVCPKSDTGLSTDGETLQLTERCIVRTPPHSPPKRRERSAL